MDLTSTLGLALENLTSPPVLAFAIGIIAVLLKADLRLPDAAYQAISMYLLLAIGLKGGVALRESSPADIVAPALIAVLLGVLIPIAAFGLLRLLTRLSAVDRGALAAHYGSTSLVTFTAALVFLEAAGIAFEGYVATLLTLLEIPGIIVGLLLARRGQQVRARSSQSPASQRRIDWESLREVLTAKSVLLLVGGLLIGVITGPAGYARTEPFFGALFTGVLTLFLLEMGALAGRRLPDVRTAGPGLLAFAVVFPVIAGCAGVLGGALGGMSPGGAAVLGVLCASASYIAAPAAVRLALPDANPGYYLTASLGITFPFNLIIGIPLYVAIAQAIA
ncbi:MAG: sodium-dependent bicarbonate transport family permease [Actinomycetales bacterium]|nr:sodium-dependent bicarbonate transport family permease [Actinomycetales bacterium]